MSSGLAHIHNLPDDLLWEILMLTTTDEYAYHRLDAARSVSQVCRRWRDIALNSAAMWGRLVHSSFFLRTDAQWQREILRRTGTAPLWLSGCNWIQCHMNAASTSVAKAVVGDVVLPLFDTRWTDIERLSLWLQAKDSKLDDPRWNKLLSPAPNMRHLLLDLEQLPKCLDPSFADVPRFRPSMYNLRKLTLWNAAFCAATIFDILEDVPLLTELSLGSDEERDETVLTTSTLPCLENIHLPHLDELEMRNILGASIVILTRIVASPTCTLRLSSSCSPDFNCDPHLKSLFKDALNRFTSNYLASPVASEALGKTLVLDLDRDFLRFAASRRLVSPAYLSVEAMPAHEFDIKLHTSDEDARPDLPEWLVETITSALFAFRAPAAVPEVFVLHVYDLAPSCAYSCLENFAQFALSMDMIEVLQTAAYMLLTCVLEDALEQAAESADDAVWAALPDLRSLDHAHDAYSSTHGLVPLLYAALSCEKKQRTTQETRPVYYNFAGSEPSDTIEVMIPVSYLQNDAVVAQLIQMSVQKI